MATFARTEQPVVVTSVEVNGRTYRAPRRPTVVIVVDGFDPAYLEHGIANGTLPTMKSFGESGFVGIADCSMPSTTNTNNTSIVTGVPPAVHGINGNYYLDAETGKEIMIMRVHLRRPGNVPAMMVFARALPGIELALTKEEVCKQFDLPIDREGDFAVFGDRNTVVGARRQDHNLTQLAGHRLRSHGLASGKCRFYCHVRSTRNIASARN